MKKSPTLNTINDNFSKIKKRFNIYDRDDNHMNPYFIGFMYQIITIFIVLCLIYFKSKVIYSKQMNNINYDDYNQYNEDNEYNDNDDNKDKYSNEDDAIEYEERLSYSKVILFYIFLQIPLFIYLIFSRFLR
jgi:hypothetical protein